MRTNLSLSTHYNYGQNSNGRDFFVGDIHGEFSLLMQALDKIHFDFNVDRLFSVGDTIDRGEDSFNCLSLAKESWFIPIIGNHEQFLIDIENENEYKYKKNIWYKNGGGWWENLNEKERKEAKEIASTYFILTLSVDTLGGRVGVVHSQYPFDRWPIKECDINRDSIHKLLWSRGDTYNNHVEGVDFIVSGHTPLSKVELKGNRLLIDTGCGHYPNEKIYTPHLTICEFKNNRIEVYGIAKEFFKFFEIKTRV